MKPVTLAEIYRLSNEAFNFALLNCFCIRKVFFPFAEDVQELGCTSAAFRFSSPRNFE
jgi:hypothetical protein